ncbi:TPA: LysR family transcriptional regulator [Vibrio vulnificus]|nr:LysR family transcriptional regulator [Vibrio vulnificus]HDY7600411.1 LysR family transcriptional regulator [Vibrio vulnificus]HDY7710987.1 LysR family transcriptional regulator [Vibrio vulnificus]
MESDVDLNLLKTMSLLCQLKNMKLVGMRLGLSESAVSKQIARLQQQVGHVLFERTPSGLEPTTFTMSILPAVEHSLAQIKHSLSSTQFRPKSYDGIISIALPMTLLECYSVAIFQRLKVEFPKAQIRLSSWNSTTIEAIKNEEVTLGVYRLNAELSNHIYQKVMLDDEIVVVISNKHKETEWQQVSKWPFIKFLSNGWNNHKFYFLEHLNALKVPLNCYIEVDTVSVAWELLQQDKCMLFIPKLSMQPNCKVIGIPDQMEFKEQLSSYRRLIDRTNPLHTRLHQLLIEVIDT